MLGLISNEHQKIKLKNSRQRKPIVKRRGQRTRSRASRGQQVRENKNKITNEESGGLVLVVKLERTDTTLDLSQKGQSGSVSLITQPALINPSRSNPCAQIRLRMADTTSAV